MIISSCFGVSCLLKIQAFTNTLKSYKIDLQVLSCTQKQENFKNGKSF